MDGGYGLGPGFHAPPVFPGGAAAGRAAVEQSGKDDAVETVDLGDKKKDSDTASGEQEGVAAAPEMPRETEKEQNGLDSLSLIPSLGGGRLDAAREAHTSTRPSARTMALLIPAPRGPILDRNGEPLAVTSVAYQLALRFEIFENPDRSRVVEFGRNCLEQAKKLPERHGLFPTNSSGNIMSTAAGCLFRSRTSFVRRKRKS